MIVQYLYLLKYQWAVEIYYAVTCYYTEEILKKIEEYNPTYEEKDKLENFIKRCKYNEGFIFTNFEKKKSLIIIGKTTSAAEFQNTVDHEKGHLAMHIAQYYEMDVFSEEFQYLQGEIGKQMFRYCRHLLCEECRKKIINYGNAEFE